jgi:hypothetical protein
MEKEITMPVQKKARVRAGRAVVKHSKPISIDDPEFQEKFEKARKMWRLKLRPLAEASRSSERLTERDLAVRINARG